MNITGEANLEVFLELIQLVIQKSGIQKPFNKFKGDEQRSLANKIKVYFNLGDKDPYPIAATTIRDYKYMCDPNNWKYPFSITEGKLDILCKYTDQNSWYHFAKKRTNKVTAKFTDSFYRSDDIFSLIYSKTPEIDHIIAHGEKILKQDNDYVEALFNVGVCLLFKSHFKKAATLFNRCSELESLNSRFYFFKSLSLLEGKRPYRHKKIIIDNIIDHLNKSIHLNPENTTYSELLYLIHQDFHQRIGYSYHRIQLVKRPPQLEWLLFLEICTGIPYKEIEKTLT